MAWPLAEGISARRQSSVPPTAGRGPGGEKGGFRRRIQLAELGQGLGPLEAGHPRKFRVRQADEQIKAQRPGDVFAQGRPHGAAVHPAEDFAGQIAEGDGVVAAGRARGPHGGHGGQLRTDGVPVEPQGRVHLVGKAGQARLVRHHLLHGDLALAGRGELRPDLGHRLAVAEPSALHQPGDEDGGDGLGGGEHRGEGALVKGLGALAVGIAAPQVHHHLLIDHHGEARAQLFPGVEILLEGATHGLKRRGDDHQGRSQWGRGRRSLYMAGTRAPAPRPPLIARVVS